MTAQSSAFFVEISSDLPILSLRKKALKVSTSNLIAGNCSYLKKILDCYIITDTLKPWNLAYHAVWLLSLLLATTSSANNSSFSVVVYTLYSTGCTSVDCVHATKDYKSNLEIVKKKFYVVNCPSLKNG